MESSGCEEKDTPTQKVISAARQLYCTNLQTCKADKASSEKTYERAVRIYRKKKKLFEWTEHNYRLYRDFDICFDTELTTGNISLTALTPDVQDFFGHGKSQFLIENTNGIVTVGEQYERSPRAIGWHLKASEHLSSAIRSAR